MSLQIQKQKLTYEELCPTWSSRAELTTSEALELATFNQCVVGEAYKFNVDNRTVEATRSYHGCGECYDHSLTINREDRSPESINSFVEHYNNAHL